MKFFGKNFYLFNRNKKRIDFNFYSPKRDERNFAKSDLVSIMLMVINRLNNVQFHANIDYIETNNIFYFLKRNALQIMQRLFYDGYIILNTETYTFRTVNYKTENYQNSIMTIELYENEICYIDSKYQSEGQTGRMILSPYIDFLNTVNNADCNIIQNYGALGVISPESTSMTDGYMDSDDKKELQTEYNDTHGLTFGKWSIMISKRPIKFTQINLPIDSLQLSDKRKNALAEILQYFNIPKELHALFENSKYSNRNEAELDMYTNTVSAFACNLIDIAELVYEQKKSEKPYLKENEFWFDVVGVPAIAEAQYNDKLRAKEELNFWKEAKIEMPEEADYINKRIKNLIENL